ncbi:Tyrosine recombinase XerD [Moorella thermoacetica]|uniref:Tyrosine recombinase XerD n=1 Tax=Neomoorella thermoacetica TaxID=1525 RepID=A0AAC9HG69_NEOTH|nr:tyrosine-type recombinase/integrase [Moorella thermoacetica]AOQ23183.1 Tyrosine recombinase XerD [Moorella thermoacetica]TYL12890.1 Tyrosine recombinase XerD [Moorella thermoacetica]
MARHMKIPQKFLNHFQKITNSSTESISYDRAVEAFTRHHRLKESRENTIRWYKSILDNFYRFLVDSSRDTGPAKITKRDIEDYILHCRSSANEITTNGRLRALKIFFGFLVKEKIIENNPAAEIPYLRAVEPVIPAFTEEQIKRLLSQIDLRTFAGLRDYVIIMLMLDTGVRIGELLNITAKDVVSTNGASMIIVRKPKGPRQRMIPLSAKMDALLQEYLSLIKELFGPSIDYLFVNQEGKQISKRTIQDRIKEYGRKAGIENVRVSPHTFRHTFAKFWVMEGGDILTLQDILGHSDLAMVKKYGKLFSPDLKIKHDLFSPLVKKDF